MRWIILIAQVGATGMAILMSFMGRKIEETIWFSTSLIIMCILLSTSNKTYND